MDTLRLDSSARLASSAVGSGPLCSQLPSFPTEMLWANNAASLPSCATAFQGSYLSYGGHQAVIERRHGICGLFSSPVDCTLAPFVDRTSADSHSSAGCTSDASSSDADVRYQAANVSSPYRAVSISAHVPGQVTSKLSSPHSSLYYASTSPTSLIQSSLGSHNYTTALPHDPVAVEVQTPLPAFSFLHDVPKASTQNRAFNPIVLSFNQTSNGMFAPPSAANSPVMSSTFSSPNTSTDFSDIHHSRASMPDPRNSLCHLLNAEPSMQPSTFHTYSLQTAPRYIFDNSRVTAACPPNALPDSPCAFSSLADKISSLPLILFTSVCCRCHDIPLLHDLLCRFPRPSHTTAALPRRPLLPRPSRNFAQR